MKKITILSILLMLVLSLSAQEFHSVESDYFRVSSQVSASQAINIATKLDAYVELFNSVLHFDLNTLESKMKVRIFADKNLYNAYLLKEGVSEKDSFVYLQYKNDTQNILLGFDMDDSELFETALIHHSFIQFFKSFVAYPPLWLQKGLAVYFEKSTYDSETETAEFKPNLGWIQTLKSFTGNGLDQLISLNEILTIDPTAANSKINLFYAQSWGMADFLLNSSNKDYNRLLFDSLTALKTDGTREENEKLIQDDVFSWVNEIDFFSDFISYTVTMKTFPDLIKDGMQYYALRQLSQSEAAFSKALELNSDHYIPYYYLGLINYDKEDFDMAEYYYLEALDYGVDQSLAYYALGVNAYADKDSTAARNYLLQSYSSSPDGYGKQANELLARIDEENKSSSDGIEEINYDMDELSTDNKDVTTEEETTVEEDLTVDEETIDATEEEESVDNEATEEEPTLESEEETSDDTTVTDEETPETEERVAPADEESETDADTGDSEETTDDDENKTIEKKQ